MFERFTDRARKVMALANQEAQDFRHEYIGTEHILLAIAKDGTGVAAAVLEHVDLNYDRIRPMIESMVKPGPDEVAPGKLHETPRAKTAVKQAIAAARELGDNYVGAEHLLLGLLRVPESVAAQVLVNLGLDFETARREVLSRQSGACEQEEIEGQLAEATPVARLQKLIFEEAVARGASDIHFDPKSDRVRVRLRIDGVLHDRDQLPTAVYGEFLKPIKTMAGMNPAETRLAQDGRMSMTIGGQRCDFRVAVVPTIHGERTVVRILRPVLATDLLGLDRIAVGEDLATIRRLTALPHGLVICSGPVGSGKTTLLYAMLREVDAQKCSVVTIEDPVEFVFPDFAQIQYDVQSGLTFARALRSVLRQDPDVVMVGEIRDLETMELCVQLALTGHLLLTTLHAPAAIDAVRRILDLGIEPHLVNSALSAVVAQRLVRRLCPDCRTPIDPPADSLPPEAAGILDRLDDVQFCQATGCDACQGMGYRGRAAIHEILVPDERFRRAVTENAGDAVLTQAARAAGTKSLLASGIEKAAHGVTTVEEVLRVTGVKDL